MQHENHIFTLRFNRKISVRVEYAPWSIEGPVPLELKRVTPLQSIFVQPAHNKMLDQADTTELVEEKESPATKHSRPQKRRPNNRQVVEDTSEEEAGAL